MTILREAGFLVVAEAIFKPPDDAGKIAGGAFGFNETVGEMAPFEATAVVFGITP